MKRVPPEINHPDSRVLFVARDPGINEVNQGQPLVGKSGWKFNEALAQAGIRRKDINITNRVLYKPWNNEFFRHKWEHINEGKRELEQLIAQLQPDLVVTMGNEATYDMVAEYRAQAGKSIKTATGITNYRGFFFWNDELECWVLPTLHPSSVLYQPGNEFQFFLDFRRAKQWLDGDLPRMEPPEPQQIRSPTEFNKLEGHDLVSFDIETKWGSSELRVTAFCGDDLQPYYVWGNNKRVMYNWLQSPQRKLAHNGKFDRYFLTYKEYMPVSNLTEDTIALHWAMYPELAGKDDTGAEEDPKKKKSGRITRKGLLFLASMYLNVPWWKDYQNDDWEMMRLCAQDVWVTRLLWNTMYPQAEKMGVLKQYRDNMDLQPSLIATQHRGMGVDNELRKDRIRTLRERRKDAERVVVRAAVGYIEEHQLDFFKESLQCKCCNGRGHGCWSCTGFTEGMPKRKSDYGAVFSDDDLANNTVAQLKDKFVPCRECDGAGTTYWYDFNLRSHTQVEELIFNELGAPQSLVLKGSYAGQDTLRRVYEDWATQPTERSELADRRATVASILREYFTAKKDGTQITIYKRLKPDRSGKIRTELSSYKVTTSRLSSSESFLEPSTNLQNLSKNTAFEDKLYQVREVIVPDPGFVWLLCDYAKAEAVIGAASRREWDHYEKLITGFDIHSEHAKDYFGEVTKAKRNICKEIEYGSAYLATAYTMAARINRNAWKTGIKLDVKTVDELLQKHFAKHGHQEWWDRVWNTGEEANFWLENPFGLRRQFTNPNEHDRHKQMVNWICQSTVASSINASWIKIWNQLDYFGLHTLAHQVHDEIILLVREDLVDYTARKVKSIMEEPFMMEGREIFIPVDIEIGYDNWQHTTKLEL